MICWHIKIISVGGGVLAGTEDPVFTHWLCQLQHLCRTGLRRWAADGGVHANLPTQYGAVRLCFSRQGDVTTRVLETF